MFPITAIATLLVGFLAATIAIWGIRTQRSIALKRATLDVIVRNENDRDVLDAHAQFNRLAKENGGLAQYAEEEHQGSPETESIRVILNQYEIVAIGIQRGILDRELYYQWFGTGLLRHWRYAEPFVQRIRQRMETDKPFSALEQLVNEYRERKI